MCSTCTCTMYIGAHIHVAECVLLCSWIQYLMCMGLEEREGTKRVHTYNYDMFCYICLCDSLGEDI